MTEKEMAQLALKAQSWNSLYAVVHAWGRCVDVLRQIAYDKGLDFLNYHPASQLFAVKVASLTGLHNVQDHWAYDVCKKMAEADTPAGK